MTKQHFLIIALCSVFLFIASGAMAENDDSFTGKLGIGVIFIDSGNNLNPDGSKKRIDSLDNAADREFTGIPMILPSVTWDAGKKGGAKVFFDTEAPIDEVGSFVLRFGGSYQSNHGTVYHLSGFTTPFEEVWQDPYLTGENRSTSDTLKYGAHFSMNHIMGSAFDVHFVYLEEEIDEDVIGALIPDMARDGSVYSVAVDYGFKISDTFTLSPQVSLRKGEYDGESSSFTKVKTKIKGMYRNGRIILLPEVSYSYKEFDEDDRIFNSSRENHSYGAHLVANYLAPFNIQGWTATTILGYSKGNSNIDFYDSEGITAGVIFSYNF